MRMGNDILYEESQYLGYNRLSFLRRMVLALFCFLSYYWSGNSVDGEGSGSLLFFLGVAIIVVSAILVFILHYRTIVENGSLILDGLWTARKVKIDLSSIKDVKSKLPNTISKEDIKLSKGFTKFGTLYINVKKD